MTNLDIHGMFFDNFSSYKGCQSHKEISIPGILDHYQHTILNENHAYVFHVTRQIVKDSLRKEGIRTKNLIRQSA